LTFLKLKEVDDLLPANPSPRYIESQIISYIMSLRESGIAYATIQFLIAPIFTFYQLNDVILNRKKVSQYMGEYKRVAKDGAYTTEQIQTALQNADVRMRMIILLLASTGCRVGALPALTLGNLTRIPNYGLYKVTCYEGTNNEMYTFTTRETAQTGIDNYLFYRKRMGENISFNEKTQRWEPEDVPLIRKQFDVNDLLQVKQPKPMELNAIRHLLTVHLTRCGLKTQEHPTAPQSNGKIRKPVSLSKGFRKRAISIFIEAKLYHEIRELIVDHATQLDHIHDKIPEEYQSCMTGMKRNLREILEIAQVTSDPKTKLQALAIAVDCYKYIMEMTTGGVIITDAIKYVQGQMNYLNKQEKKLLKDIKDKNGKGEEPVTDSVGDDIKTTNDRVF
jgi:site-specific recombinase XerD